MSYKQTGLSGSGTALDPFLIYSYEDWLKIDARYDIEDEPPHYRMETDLNFMLIKDDMRGANFLGGTLDMNNHSIINPFVKLGSYIIRDALVIGGPLEVLYPNGHVMTKGGEGKIIGIKGTHVEMLFHKCIFKRVYIVIEVGDMNIDRQDISLTGQISGEQCFISIDNEGFNTHPLIACLPNTPAPFVDTCFEFKGMAFDEHLIDRWYSTSDPNEVVLDHCMVYGSLDLSEMTRHYTSSETYICNGGIKSCIINVNGKGARDEQGYRGFGTYIDMSDGPSLAVRKNGFYMAIDDPTKVKTVNDGDYRKPDSNIAKGFDLLKLR